MADREDHCQNLTVIGAYSSAKTRPDAAGRARLRDAPTTLRVLSLSHRASGKCRSRPSVGIGTNRFSRAPVSLLYQLDLP